MSYKILLADDDLEDLELMEEAILHAEPGIELKKFTNGMSVIEYLDASQDDELPSLIVLDYNMPQMNGSQLLSAVNTGGRYQTIPKVVVSTSNAPVHIRECMNNGAVDYIVKPANMLEMNSLVKKLLALCAAR